VGNKVQEKVVHGGAISFNYRANTTANAASRGGAAARSPNGTVGPQTLRVATDHTDFITECF
jgi:hypothetical protein